MLAFALVVSALASPPIPLLKHRVPVEPTPARRAVAVREGPTLLLGLVLGVLVALTSVGAGAIGVVALTALYHCAVGAASRRHRHRARHPADASSPAPATRMGNVDLSILGFLLIGSVPGIALGSRITGLVPDWVLRVALRPCSSCRLADAAEGVNSLSGASRDATT